MIILPPDTIINKTKIRINIDKLEYYYPENNSIIFVLGKQHRAYWLFKSSSHRDACLNVLDSYCRDINLEVKNNLPIKAKETSNTPLNKK